jgi:hypothetical protein
MTRASIETKAAGESLPFLLRVAKLAEPQSYCVLIAGLTIAAAPSIFDRANFCQVDTDIFYVRHAQHVSLKKRLPDTRKRYRAERSA